MHRSIRRLAAPVLLCGLAILCKAGRASDEAKPAGESGFSGSWKLAASTDNVVVRPKKEGWDFLGGGGDGSGSAGGATGGGGFDLPIEVMTDARHLVVADDGTTLRVTYPSGRKRVFVTDDRERYLDDGDGRANVTARRKGETVTVTSEWARGYKLRESWELRANPRRLVVTGKVTGRESRGYVRNYELGPPAEPGAAPAASGASPSPPADAEGAAAPGATAAAVEPGAPAVDRLHECSIHPPRNASPEELDRLVKVSQQEAGKAAVASVSPSKASDVISSDVEAFEGCLVWPFTLRLPGRKGVQEVFVDAGDGKVVRSEFVPMSVPQATPEAP